MTSNAIHTLLQQWTGFDSLEAIETSTLEKYIAEHPYSPTLQLLLAKKYALDGSPLLEKQLQKTTAYFPSVLQLHHWFKTADTSNSTAPLEHKLNSILTEQLAQFQEPLKEEKLEFEQEETTLQKDYFAAQGIHIDLSKVPQDKFTQQLRSFTAWLKVLKHTDMVENTPELVEKAEEQDKVIAAIAEKANKAEDIITESMAEIWAKQGNKRKAIDTYLKLSFIFPEKSVYFASRIEQLKQKK